MCEENSTEIPTAITKLTSETAFNVISHLKSEKWNLISWIKLPKYLRGYIKIIFNNYSLHNIMCLVTADNTLAFTVRTTYQGRHLGILSYTRYHIPKRLELKP